MTGMYGLPKGFFLKFCSHGVAYYICGTGNHLVIIMIIM